MEYLKADGADMEKGQALAETLAGEILDALNFAGGACKRKDEMQKMADANKAFSNFKWYDLPFL